MRKINITNNLMVTVILLPVLLLIGAWQNSAIEVAQFDKKPEIDLYQRIQQHQANDTVRLELLVDYLDLIQLHKDSSEVASTLISEALELSHQLPYSPPVNSNLRRLGSILVQGSKYQLALRCFNTLYIINQLGDNKEEMAFALNRIGRVYRVLGVFEIGLKYHLECLNISQEIGDSSLIADSFLRIGWCFMDVKNYDNAHKYFTLAQELSMKLNDKKRLSDIYNAFGAYYRQTGDYDKAISFHKKNFAQRQSEKEIPFAITMHNLARVYFDRGQFQEALDLVNRSIALKKELGSKSRVGISLNLLSEIYSAKGESNLAIEEANNAFVIADEIGSNELKITVAKTLSKIYNNLQNQNQSRHFELIHLRLKDSLINQVNTWELSKIESQNEIQRKDLEISMLKERRTAEARQKLLLTWAVVLAVLLGLVMLFYFRARLRFSQKNLLLNKELLLIKSRFFANISHEQRTPLAVLQGTLSQVISQDDVSKENRQRIGLAIQQADELKMMTDQILDLSKFTEKKIDLDLAPVDISSLIHACFERFESRAESKQIDYQLNYLLDTNIWIETDVDKLNVIVRNLIDNAIKYTPSGGKIIVSVDQTLETHQLKIVVKDTGIGIGMEDKVYIFDRYYQAKSGLATGAGGVGIGLAYVEELTKLFGGKIKVSSRLGEGSTFTLLLPMKIVQKVEDQSLVSHGPDKAYNDFLGISQNMDTILNQDKLTVLLTEDHPGMRSCLQDILSPHYNLIVAENGKKSMDLLHSSTYDIDLLITDAVMPEVDGFTLVERIRSDEKFDELVLIMLTGKTGQEDKTRALRLGVDDYITKPFSAEELLVRCQNLLRRKQERLNFDLHAEEFEHQNEEEPGMEFFASPVSLLKKAEEILRRELANPQFSIHDLAEELGISERTILRKIKKATGLSTNHFFREIRLMKARELLLAGNERSVAEVSYAVGIESPSYFTKIYYERFGKRPSDFIYEALD
ncbi:MAG: tetratricopeptide repeat protein [Reichenbachiella sp.]|uniref:tetratricopeptide repeat protein n=1 Tax=Reichenbachiella sp. TaxID=2184521 RepID=UPI003263BA7C